MAWLLATTFEANLIFGIFLLMLVFGLVLGFFTVRGSGINNHPWEGHAEAPGARLPDEFHQFSDRQVHDADLRHEAQDRRIAAMLAEIEATGEDPTRRHIPHPHVPRLMHRHQAAAPPD